MEPTAKDIAAIRKIADIIDIADISTEPKSGTPEAKAWVKRYNAAMAKVEDATKWGGKLGGFETRDFADIIYGSAGHGLADLRELLSTVL